MLLNKARRVFLCPVVKWENEFECEIKFFSLLNMESYFEFFVFQRMITFIYCMKTVAVLILSFRIREYNSFSNKKLAYIEYLLNYPHSVN